MYKQGEKRNVLAAGEKSEGGCLRQEETAEKEVWVVWLSVYEWGIKCEWQQK